MAYLRLRIIRRNPLFKDLYDKKLLKLNKIQNLELEQLMLNEYETVLKHLFRIYDPMSERDRISV